MPDHTDKEEREISDFKDFKVTNNCKTLELLHILQIWQPIQGDKVSMCFAFVPLTSVKFNSWVKKKFCKWSQLCQDPFRVLLFLRLKTSQLARCSQGWQVSNCQQQLQCTAQYAYQLHFNTSQLTKQLCSYTILKLMRPIYVSFKNYISWLGRAQET